MGARKAGDAVVLDVLFLELPHAGDVETRNFHMEFSSIANFALAATALALMPGPDNIFVLTESATRGRLRGFVVSLGFASGVIVHTALCATGLSIVVANSPSLFGCVKIAGAAYLGWLCVRALMERPSPPPGLSAPGAPARVCPLPALYAQGFLMNVLNPKVAISFIAFLPQFVSPGGISESAQMFVFGGIFMAVTVIVFGMVALAGGALRPVMARAGFWRAERWVRAAVFGGIALFIVF